MGSIVDATSGFVLLDGLKALAVSLAEDLDACSGNPEMMKLKPQLSRQYRETMSRIDAIEGGEDGQDEIAAIILRNREPGSD